MKPDPADGKGAMGLDPSDNKKAMRSDAEGLMDAEELVDVEGLADVNKSIVIHYNLSVFHQ